MKITFLVYDNDASVNDFPLGVGYLISVLRQRGHADRDIHVYSMDVYHYSEEDLFAYLDGGAFDVVGIGMIAGYWQFKQLGRMMAAIGRLKKKPVVVLGGFMFSPDPAYFLRKFPADYVVIGEAEGSCPMLLERLAAGRGVEDVPGLARWSGGAVIVSPRASPIRDLDSIPFPAWDRFPIENYVSKIRVPVGRGQRSMPVITSRGCAYQCTFCYRMEPGYRRRSLDNVMEEVRRLITDYRVNTICFRDELMMISAQRAIEFAERILREKLDIRFDIDGRLNAARPEALKLLKKSGCVYINYGVESLDQDVLDKMNKRQTVEDIITGVEATVAEGINPGLNVLFGNLGDSRESARKTVEFLLKYNLYGELRTLKPVTPYPGSPLYELAIEKGLLADCADFYENKHLNSDRLTCNFTTLTDDEVYEVLFESNRILIDDHFRNIAHRHHQAHRKLYFEGDTSFRGVRH